jgi:O-methyltransferase
LVEKDMSENQFLKVSLEQVRRNFARFDLLDDARIKFLKGWFKDTIASAPIERLAVLRLDGDLYESTMDVLRPLYAKVSPGGFVIVDDYFAWAGCRKAVDEFRAANGISAAITRIDWTGAYWRK